MPCALPISGVAKWEFCEKAAAVVVCKRLAEQDCSAALLLLPSPANFSFPSFPFTSFEVKSH